MSLHALPQAESVADATSIGFEDVPAVMSPKQLGELLDVSPRTLERWRITKTGPSYFTLPASSLIRYSRADVLAWLTASRVEVTP